MDVGENPKRTRRASPSVSRKPFRHQYLTGIVRLTGDSTLAIYYNIHDDKPNVRQTKQYIVHTALISVIRYIKNRNIRRESLRVCVELSMYASIERTFQSGDVRRADGIDRQRVPQGHTSNGKRALPRVSRDGRAEHLKTVTSSSALLSSLKQVVRGYAGLVVESDVRILENGSAGPKKQFFAPSPSLYRYFL